MSLFGKNEKSKPAKNGAAAPPPASLNANSKVAAAPKPDPSPPQRADPALNLSEDQAKAAARVSHQLHLATGQIMTVLMNAPECQKLSLENVRALVAPAVSSGQFVLAMARSKQNGRVAPAAVALWASVSDEVDKRLSTDLDKFSIAASEWRSGPNAWLIMMAGDRRVLNPMLAKLQKNTLRGRPLKLRAADKDGKVSVRSFMSSEDIQQTPSAHLQH
jgi:cytolysin-activating lysine-acyltransferase